MTDKSSGAIVASPLAWDRRPKPNRVYAKGDRLPFLERGAPGATFMPALRVPSPSGLFLYAGRTITERNTDN